MGSRARIGGIAAAGRGGYVFIVRADMAHEVNVTDTFLHAP
jgi:hypothetical protein